MPIAELLRKHQRRTRFELTEDHGVAIGTDSKFQAAYAVVLRKLRARDCFAAEVHAAAAAATDDVTADAVVERLIEKGVVDDARLVEAHIRANVGRSVVSLSSLRLRCEKRGASESALALFIDAEEPDLSTLLAKYERDDQGRAKAYRNLAYRGFDEETIVSALNQFWPEP